MKNFFKRFVNSLAILGTCIGIGLLSLSNYNFKIECLQLMVVGYVFIAGLNYLFFGKPTIWNELESVV
jgi:hypothetical protein